MTEGIEAKINRDFLDVCGLDNYDWAYFNGSISMAYMAGSISEETYDYLMNAALSVRYSGIIA